MGSGPLRGRGEVAEDEATGALADAYAALRSALGVPFVPTIYRMLGVYDRLLVAAVDALAPLLRRSRTPSASPRTARARGAQAAARLPGGPLDGGAHTDDALAVLERYNAANPRSLLFVLGMRPADAGPPTAVLRPPLPPPAGSLLDDVLACHGGFTVPGAWRELAAWPSLAAAGWDLVRSLAAEPELQAARADIVAGGRERLTGVTVPTASELGYGPQDAAAVDRILAWFPDGIPAMVVEIEILRHRLTAAAPQPDRSAT